MNKGTKKPLHEKIILFILYLIGSPFIIGGLLLFIVIYLIIFPLEILFYLNSYYKKEVNEKYYLLITFSKSYNTYNKLRKKIKNKTTNDILSFESNNEVIFIVKDNKTSLDNLLIPNKTNYFVINKKGLEKPFLAELNSKYNLIIYND